MKELKGGKRNRNKLQRILVNPFSSIKPPLSGTWRCRISQDPKSATLPSPAALLGVSQVHPQPCKVPAPPEGCQSYWGGALLALELFPGSFSRAVTSRVHPRHIRTPTLLQQHASLRMLQDQHSTTGTSAGCETAVWEQSTKSYRCFLGFLGFF